MPMVRIGYGDQGLEARFGLRPARSRQNLDPAPARRTVATPEATSVPRPASTPTIAPARRVERELGCQLAAFFTSSAMRASTRSVSFVTANAIGHISSSSILASGWKPNVEYRTLNFEAGWKKQITLPSLA